MTEHTQTVLRILLGRGPDGERIPTALTHGIYGLELANLSGLPNGTLFPLLERLRRADWVERYWEDDETAEAEGRPRRRYFRLTSKGAERAPLALAHAMAEHAAEGALPRRTRHVPRAAS
ncbi:PadR family transcriptional regulator [Actinomadura logoneensis]|uniref:PadR family transcriptional regulator n=2 Tax=Actinomadura logoneensis TaxID=2293572 RepID=A0A372JJV8_9ACTN|nr:PadR family transcriptional regulator [Actinomadura logoneensis]